MAPEIFLIQSWSTLLVGYPKWKVDVDSGKFPFAKMLRFEYRSSRTQTDTLGGKETMAPFLKTNVASLTWTCTQQITLLPTSTEELSIPPALSFTKDQCKR